MRYLVAILRAVGALVFARPPGDATDTPDVVAKMVQGLAASKLDHLTSKTYVHKGGQYSDHLKTIDYLGTV
jgi:hypothetical protein